MRSRTLLLNTVRGSGRTPGRRLATGSVQTFSTRVRALFGDTLPGYVARQLATVEHLHAALAAADSGVRGLAEADPVAQRLMTVPGVGPVTAVRFIAALDDRIPALRGCLVQAAHCARRTLRPSPLRDWVEAIERRRGRQIATVALARTLTGILYALGRDGSRYDPFKSNMQPARPVHA